MPSKLAVILIAVALVAIVASAGCMSTTAGKYNTAQDTNAPCDITDYNNGVVFFGCSEGKYATALSNYISKHNVVATSSSLIPMGSTYNSVYGYVVTFSEKEPVEQTINPFEERTPMWYYCNAANTSECWKNASDIPLYSARATMYRGV